VNLLRRILSAGAVCRLVLILPALPTAAWAQTPLWQGHGRIVVSADGNEHDHDDWAATPLSLAILAARGLQDSVPLYIYADHVWGSNHEHPGVNGVTPYEQMKESALTGGKLFGFKRTRFIAAVDRPEIAYEALKDEINRSSTADPLFIVAAGPVHVIGEAMSRANRDRRRFVTVITMVNCWNDVHADNPYVAWEQHSGWTMPEIRQQFAGEDGGGLRIVSIQNQNPRLMRNWHEYEWLKTALERHDPAYGRGSWEWLFNRLCMSIKPVSGDENYYAIDASDAGKVVCLLTGIEETSPLLCYQIMKAPVRPRR
jgi:hypothetical protein